MSEKKWNFLGLAGPVLLLTGFMMVFFVHPAKNYQAISPEAWYSGTNLEAIGLLIVAAVLLKFVVELIKK